LVSAALQKNQDNNTSTSDVDIPIVSDGTVVQESNTLSSVAGVLIQVNVSVVQDDNTIYSDAGLSKTLTLSYTQADDQLTGAASLSKKLTLSYTQSGDTLASFVSTYTTPDFDIFDIIWANPDLNPSIVLQDVYPSATVNVNASAVPVAVIQSLEAGHMTILQNAQ